MTNAVAVRSQPDSPGEHLTRRENTALERRVTLAITIAPFLGVCVAVPLVWARGVSALDLVLLLTTYLIAGVGVTVGYHRYFTHGSFRALRPLRIVLAVAGALAIEGGVVGWVATHRRHHAMSDREGDPHSPHLEEPAGLRSVIAGLWHSHIGWMFEAKETSIPRWAPDLLRDSTIVALDRWFPMFVVVSLAGPALVGLALTRSIGGAFTAFVWGGLVRAFFVHHVTWSINSICHFYGARPFETKDRSTNNWALSVVSLGESWHNTHHAFPTSAVHGLERGQLDISGTIIRAFEWLGLADEVKRPDDRQLAAKRRTDS